jgi:hypothetical protein
VYFVLDATAFATRVCSVYLFGGTLGQLSLRQMSGMGKFWGGIGGNLEAVGNVLWVNVKDGRPQIILYLRWGSYLGPSNAKRNEKKTALKSSVLGLGLPHLPEQQQDYNF